MILLFWRLAMFISLLILLIVCVSSRSFDKEKIIIRYLIIYRLLCLFTVQLLCVTVFNYCLVTVYYCLVQLLLNYEPAEKCITHTSWSITQGFRLIYPHHVFSHLQQLLCLISVQLLYLFDKIVYAYKFIPSYFGYKIQMLSK